MAALTEVNQGESSRLTITLTDYDGTDVALSALSTLALTIYDKDTDTVLNDYENLNIKNANGATITDGGGTVLLPAACNAMVSTTKARETHIALVKFTTSNNLAGSVAQPFDVLRVRS